MADAAVELRVVGDIMLGRMIGALATKRGANYLMEPVTALLQGGDFTVGNLESPLATSITSGPEDVNRLIGSPALAAELQSIGFDALSVANNHTFDAGATGAIESGVALRSAGIVALGGGERQATVYHPWATSAKGLRVAMFAFNDVAGVSDISAQGKGWFRANLGPTALEAVSRANANADLVVVLVHWGHEYETRPAESQRRWANALLEAGADVILGSHPHVLQPIEIREYKGRTRLVAFSLGNFLFDQWSDPATATSVVLRIGLDDSGVAWAEAAPTITERGRVRPVSPASVQGRRALHALGIRLGQPSATGIAVTAWSWDGTTANETFADTITQPPARVLRADLQGNGKPLLVTLNPKGRVQVFAGTSATDLVVWDSEELGGPVLQIETGDPNNDGRIEILLLLWKPGHSGKPGTHPFLFGWRSGKYQIIWGGSATDTIIQDVAIADLDGDGRDELITLRGGASPDRLGTHVEIASWQGWYFVREWQSASGCWSGLDVIDSDGDQYPNVIAAESPCT